MNPCKTSCFIAIFRLGTGKQKTDDDYKTLTKVHVFHAKNFFPVKFLPDKLLHLADELYYYKVALTATQVIP